ncbi:nuclear transport factor 2 family protein [Streptomyces sp. NPDC026673]|uniref:nuclear transport factor 2 family protein n=1 Tax=Streptomyces sp. NPDC026673 TaxID=3155724 RepID=UPI00340A3844
MSVDNDTLVRAFVEAFATKDTDRLLPFLHTDVVFRNYGDDEIRGRDALLEMWRNVFDTFEQVSFETVHQAVNGDVVIAEQVHGLGLPGRAPAPVMNLAVYELREGRIAAWRDYTNPDYARALLR